MTSIFDVAKFILEKKERVTSYELQKLCYYCKAWSLALGEGELFQENFEAWPHGPVCYNLFKEHQNEFKVTKKDIAKGSKDNVTPADSDIICTVIDVYSGMNGNALEEKTHNETPWIVTRGNLPPEAKCRKVIDNNIIKQYYRNSKEYETIENVFLLTRAKRRDSEKTRTYSFAETMELLGISSNDLEGWEDVEIEA